MVISADQNRQLIPHRHPFNMLDQVVVFSENHGEGHAYWPENHIIFKGHFPEYSIVPGVLFIEAAAQTAAVLYKSTVSKKSPDSIEVLAGANQFRVYKPLYPDQKLVIDTRLKRVMQTAGTAKVRGTLDGELVFSATLLLSLQNSGRSENG